MAVRRNVLGEVETLLQPLAGLLMALVGIGAVGSASAEDWTVATPNSVLIDSSGNPYNGATVIDERIHGEGVPFSGDGSAAMGGVPTDDASAFAAANAFNAAPDYGTVPHTYAGCGAAGCVGGCDSCVGGGCPPARRSWKKEGICWVGRTDALILWRDAPPARPLVDLGLSGVPVLNANGMDSEAAAGPRFSLFRVNQCNGTAWETTYLRAANWRSLRPLSVQSDGYALAPPGIYGNDNTYNFDTGVANLGSSLQSLEFNRHWSKGQNLRFLAGFRWVEWNESFSLSDTFTGPPAINDFYNTNCINSLYGGQIGLDAWLLSLPWMRIDSVIKAGAYYNNAVQSSLYQADVTGELLSQGVTINESPVSCAFVGEIGFTGVVPITSCLDFRFGYFGLWLSGIAQPTQQLSSQVLTQPAGGVEPAAGTINANGSTLVQGVSLGLEGRW